MSPYLQTSFKLFVELHFNEEFYFADQPDRILLKTGSQIYLDPNGKTRFIDPYMLVIVRKKKYLKTEKILYSRLGEKNE